jgi:hypothetical protein
MDETMKNTATEELNTEEEGTIEVPVEASEDTFKEVVEEELKKIQRQNLLLGAQTMCRVVLDKIITFKTKPGKPTMNDYKRLVKEIQKFCETGLSRKVTADGETVPHDEEPAAEETVQN